MKKHKRMIQIIAIVLVMLLGLCTGCTSAGLVDAQSSSSAAETEETGSMTAEEADESAAEDASAQIDYITGEELDISSMFSDRDRATTVDEATAAKITFSGDAVSVNGSGAQAEGTTVTISEEGVYMVSGTLDDGQIIVDADDTAKVQLVLNGVTMTNDDSACILVLNADKVFVTAAAGSENTLSDTGAAYTQQSEEYTVDGVIYSRDDLVVNGSGSITVNAGYCHGIVGKDDLKVVNVDLDVTAAGKGMAGNDSIRIAGATVTVESVDDCIHTSNANGSKGYIYIESGTLVLSSGDDGIHAESALRIDGGDITVKESYEGMEGATVDINGGTFDITASDDGINAAIGTNENNNASQMSGTAADGQMPQMGEMPADGEMPAMGEESADGTMPQMGETATDGAFPQGGPQMPGGRKGRPGETGTDSNDSAAGQMPEMPADGMMPEMGGMPSDGTMPEMGEMPSGCGSFGMGGMGMMEVDERCVLHITDGTITVNSGGDALDSNGSIVIDGGDIAVYGPTNSGNSAIDYGTGAVVNGGTVRIAGSSGMAENFGSDSKQVSLMYNFSTVVSAGTEVILTDESGRTILSFTPEKEYQSVIFSSADLKEGTYTISAGNQSENITLEGTSNTFGAAAGMRY